MKAEERENFPRQIRLTPTNNREQALIIKMLELGVLSVERERGVEGENPNRTSVIIYLKDPTYQKFGFPAITTPITTNKKS